jgi:hypothetical protein
MYSRLVFQESQTDTLFIVEINDKAKGRQK